MESVAANKLGGNGMNGNLDAVWEKVNRIAEKGCGLASVHGEAIRLMYDKIEDERKDREKMGDKLEEKMSSIRNQILIGMGVLMAIALVVDKILK